MSKDIEFLFALVMAFQANNNDRRGSFEKIDNSLERFNTNLFKTNKINIHLINLPQVDRFDGSQCPYQGLGDTTSILKKTLHIT